MSDQPVLAGPDSLKPVRRRILYAMRDVASLRSASHNKKRPTAH